MANFSQHLATYYSESLTPNICYLLYQSAGRLPEVIAVFTSFNDALFTYLTLHCASEDNPNKYNHETDTWTLTYSDSTYKYQINKCDFNRLNSGRKYEAYRIEGYELICEGRLSPDNHLWQKKVMNIEYKPLQSYINQCKK